MAPGWPESRRRLQITDDHGQRSLGHATSTGAFSGSLLPLKTRQMRGVGKLMRAPFAAGWRRGHQEPWSVASLRASRFALLVLTMSAAAMWLMAAGLERLSAWRRTMDTARASRASASPRPYDTQLVAIPALLRRDRVPTERAWLAIVRVDSAGPKEEERICAAVRQELATSWHFVWLALSLRTPRCFGARPARDVLTRPPELHVAARLRSEFRDARWAIVDSSFRVVYSARRFPTRDDIYEIAALLFPDSP